MSNHYRVCIFVEISSSQIGDLIIEGKTKRVLNLKGAGNENLVYVLSKDRITAGKLTFDQLEKRILKIFDVSSSQAMALNRTK